MLVASYQLMWHNKTEDFKMQQHHRESHNVRLVLCSAEGNILIAAY
jgi:hypothetical protein